MTLDEVAGTNTRKWLRRYMDLAKHVAQWSKDPSTKVGAVLVGRDRKMIALGYNGFPPGIADDSRLADRPTKYRLIQHAERNVIDNTSFDSHGGTLVVTLFPCSECAKSIVSKGIARVVTTPVPDREPWRSEATWTTDMLAEAGVEVVIIDLEGRLPAEV